MKIGFFKQAGSVPSPQTTYVVATSCRVQDILRCGSMSDNSLIFSRTQENVFTFLLDTTSGEALGVVSGHAAIFPLNNP